MRTAGWWIILGLGAAVVAATQWDAAPRVTSVVFIGAPSISDALEAAYDGAWTDDSAPVRDALLERFPVGSPKTAIVRALARESFDCRDTQSGVRAVPGDPVRAREDYVDCQKDAANGSGTRRWVLDLWFDGDDRLLGVRAAVWTITLRAAAQIWSRH